MSVQTAKEGMLLEMRGIKKSFGSLEVLHGVDLRLMKGEVLALMGENGAGKSTMIKILAGIYPPNEGDIYLEGEKLGHETPIRRMESGIAVIYQELNYYNDLTVAENLFVGRYPMKGSGPFKRLDRKKMSEMAVDILRRVKLNVSPDTLCRRLSVAQKQLLEIAKAVSRNARVVVMDEPTSALNDAEVENLFSIVRELKKTGVSIIYISHKLDEIFVVCDRVMVMRDGNFISVNPIGEISRAQIVSDMVGRKVSDGFVRSYCEPGEVLLEARNLTTKDGQTKNVDFIARRGEIITLYGLMGSGRGHILETVFGLHAIGSGELIYKGQPFHPKSPEESIQKGMAFVPAERKTDGVILGHSIGKNLSLPSLKDFSMGACLNKGKEKKIIDKAMQVLSVKAENAGVLAGSLSGGNQQKVVIGKWLARDPELFIVHEPTKGIDVGTKFEIYTLLDEMCAKGACVLLVTSELPEVLSLSDRIYIVRNGTITGEISGHGVTQEILMKKAIGGLDDEGKV